MDHIVYCDSKSKELERLLDGKKTMIIRGAAGRKLPYGRVAEGETLYLLENNGEGLIRASAEVARVWNSDRLTPEASKRVLEENMKGLQLTPEQAERWKGKRYLCLIEVRKVSPVSPFTYERSAGMDDWIMVEDIGQLRKEVVEK